MDYQDFLRSLEFEQNLSATSIRAYANDLSLFCRFLADSRIDSVAAINRPVINAYIDHMSKERSGRLSAIGLSHATISRRLASVSSFLDYTKATSLPTLVNPIRGVRRKNRKQSVSKAVDDKIISQLLSGISIQRDRCLVALYLSTGLRLSELRQLNRDGVEFRLQSDRRGGQSVVGVGSVIGKGSKERTFYVDSQTLPLLAEYLASRSDEHPAMFLSERKQRISARAIQYTLSSWCRKLGLPHIHPHQLRHTYATRLANADIDQLQLKELMGHSDFNTTLKYFKLADQKVAQGYFAAMELYRPQRS